MSNVLFLKLARESYNGLCNQLLSLVSGILHCIKLKKELLVIDKFLTEINSSSYCSISQVFDLGLLNKYLQKYKINVVDGFNINSNVFRPISWDIINLAKKQNNEKLLAFINEIYQNIYFSKHLAYYAIRFINEKIPDFKTKSVNVIHLRIEDDGIQHWSKQNNMSEITFKKKLTDKYINLISSNINKKDTTLILTGETKNDVVDYMQSNNYNIMFIDKKFNVKQNSRELNAIIDLIIGKFCNNIFIGCDGSTFSELLSNTMQYMNESGCIIQKIMFDLNNINI